MTTLGKLIAGVCAVLLIVTGVTALLLFNVERKAFSSATYKQAFENQKLYERMPDILAAALSTSIAENQNADSYLKALTTNNLESSLSSLLPPAELQTLTDDALDSTFDYINGKSDSAVISLLPFKRHLASDSGVEAVKNILRAQPECTVEQLTQMGLGLLTGEDLILCNPPKEMLELITPVIETQLQFMIAAFPNEVTLISGNRSGTANDPRLKLDRTRALMKLTPLLPLIFLFGITVLAVRSLMDWLKWWGYPFVVTGASSLLIALLGAPIIGLIMERVMQNQGAGFMPPILLATMRETVSAVALQILKPVAVEGLMLALLGSVMVIFAAYRAKRETRNTGI